MRHIRERVMQDVRAFFEHHNHNPSEDIYEALADIPATAADIIEGRAQHAMHICNLDVGMGKTTTLRYTVKSLREHAPDVGIVLCLGRLEQIEAVIGELGLAAEEYAVLVGKDARTKEGVFFSELGLGVNAIDVAPVLITSHQQLEIRLQGTSWSDARAFWYDGSPRQLRIWDEAIEMRRHFSISERDVGKVMGADIPAFLRDYAVEVLLLLRKSKHGDLVDLPEVGGEPDILAILENLRDRDYKEVSTLIRNLLALSGKRQALAVRDGKEPVVIQYDLNLPDDLLPLIVLDASAKDRETYNQQIEEVVLLKDAEKRYDNVTIHVKNGPPGKRAFWVNHAERLREVADIIRSHPNKSVLIIHPKEVYKWQVGKIRGILERELGEDAARVRYLHWGAHDAVNDYADCDLVIALTLYILPRHAYEIMGRAAANRRVNKEYDPDAVKAIERGEILRHIRQGLGRSCIRKLEGNQAKPCTIYVQVPSKSQIKKEIKPLFPGCKIANAEGRLDAEEQVLAFVQNTDANVLPFPAVYHSLRIAQPNFSTLVKRPALVDALTAEGWSIISGAGRRAGKLVRI